MNEGFRLRVKYRITGRLAFLSHLETIRSMERVVRRASLPFAITEGFNPHMKIAFGPALPVGAGSLSEYFDVRLREYVSPDEALAAMQAAASQNLMPVSCEYCELGADSIDVAFPMSVWEGVFDGGERELADVENAFDALVERGFIEVKKTKGRKETIKRVDFGGRLVDGPRVSLRDRKIKVTFTTFQGTEGALRPDKFIAAAQAIMETPVTLVGLMRRELRGA